MKGSIIGLVAFSALIFAYGLGEEYSKLSNPDESTCAALVAHFEGITASTLEKNAVFPNRCLVKVGEEGVPDEFQRVRYATPEETSEADLFLNF